jgi:multicomponent Na+:H+ antiporter subunit F
VSGFLALVVVVLTLALLGGLIRVLLGPTPPDRMVAAQLLGTSGVGILLVMAEGDGAGALRDVALVLATLAGVVTLAFVELHPKEQGDL